MHLRWKENLLKHQNILKMIVVVNFAQAQTNLLASFALWKET